MRRGKVLIFTIIALLSLFSLRDKEIVLRVPDVPEMKPLIAEAGGPQETPGIQEGQKSLAPPTKSQPSGGSSYYPPDTSGETGPSSDTYAFAGTSDSSKPGFEGDSSGSTGTGEGEGSGSGIVLYGFGGGVSSGGGTGDDGGPTPSGGGNSAPTINSFSPTDTTPSVDEGSSLDFSVSATDPDSDPLTYTWRLDGNDQLSTTNSWTYNPDYDSSGDHTVRIIVSDGSLTDEEFWTVTVNDAQEPSGNVIINELTPTSGTEGIDILIQGAGFSATPSENTVTFDTIQSDSVTVVSQNQLRARVPEGLTPGFADLSVSVNGDNSNLLTFDVLTDATSHVFTDETPTGINITEPSIVKSGDIDNDGDLDLLIVDTTNEIVYVLVNDGTGSFTEGTAPPISDIGDIADLTFGDIDLDSDLDILLAYKNGQSVRLFVNNGSGAFTDMTGTNLPTISNQAVSLDLGDIDGDGDLDVVVANRSTQETPIVSDTLLINDGTGVFTEDTQFNLPAATDASTDILFLDVDGDGDLDIFSTNNEIVGSTLNTLRNRIYINDGQGAFTDETLNLLPGNNEYSEVLDFGDIDADGDMDIIIGNYSQDTILVNNGSGSFEDRTTDYIPSNYFASKDARLADIDGDGDLDILMLGELLGEAKLSLLTYNDTLGYFEDASIKAPDYQSAPAAIGGKCLELADIDNDGDLDIIIGGSFYILVNKSENKAPVLDSIGNKVIGVGGTLTFNVTATDPNNNPLIYSAENLPGGSTFASQVFNWTPGSGDIGDHLGIRFIATEDTPSALEDTEDITITVTAANLPVIDYYTPAELDLSLLPGQIVQFGIRAHDPLGGDLTFTWYFNGEEIPAVGDATSSLIFIIPRIGSNTVEVRVTNAEGTVSLTWNINVGVNEPPTIDSYTPLASEITIDLTVGGFINFGITASDPENDPLTYVWKFDGNELSTGETLDASAYGAFATVGDHIIEVSVNDGHNAPVTHTWILHIIQSGVNLPPTIDSFTPIASEITIDLAVGGFINFGITASDPENDPLTYSWKFDGQELSTGQNLDASAYAALATVGDHTVEVSVSDGNNPPVTHSWTLHIIDTSANEPPTIDSFSPIEAEITIDLAVDPLVDFSITASDPENDPLTYLWTIDGQLVSITTSLDGDDYAAHATLGDHTVVVSVNDGNNPPVLHSWILHITDSSANQPPTIDSFTPTETEINIDLAVDPLVDFAITASDPENDPLTYEWTFGGQTVSTTANLDDTDYAALATVGDHTVLVSVTDGNNPPVTHSWTLHITDTSANQPPTIDSFSPIETTVNLDVGDSQEFSVTASDPENDPLTYSWTVDGTPVGTNSNSYTYNATTTGQFIIRITVTDSITLNPPYQEWTVNVQSPDMLEDILKKTFGFFWYETDNPSTGLIRDRLLANVPDPSVDSQYNKASMAATGFGLAAMCVAAEKYGDGTNSDWQITPAELAARVEMILDTLLGIQANQAQAGDATWGIDGFFYHFVNIETGERWVNSEVSSIDTAILVAGALTAGEYFESINANIKTKAEQVYANINWASFIDNTPGAHKGQFYKQWMPGGVGYNNGHWDYNDESLLLYLLAIGSPNTQYAIDPDCYYSVRRELGSYATDGKAIVKTWFGSLFAYQYPHAFFDLRDMHDARNLDLWQNSTDATIANRQFCLDEGAASGYNQHVWGISSAYEAGAQYTGELGAPPLASPGGVVHTGTINPSVVGCAISMLPQEAGDTLLSLKSDPNLWYGDKYGFVGSFKNSTPPVYADYFVGIDLGSMLAMIANYNESGLIWNSFMDAATRYGTMRDLLTTLNFRPNADPKFYVDTDDISAKSQFAYGLIDSTNPTYQISFGLTSVTPNTEYLLALQIFMNNFVGNYDVTVNVNVNGTDQGNQTCSHIENTEDRIKYIDIDSVDLQTGENIITLTWQSGASWLAWKNAELSTPVLTNEWTIVTTELGNEYRVDNTYYAGHADSSLHGTDAYNTFERALNRVTDPYTEISFYMDDLSHDRIITLESLFADGTVYVDLIVNEQLAADNVTMNSSQQVTIPAGLLESGWNVIKLQIDSQGGEWIVWNTIDLALGNPVSLEPPEELAAAAFGADTVNLRWESVNGTAIRYNLYRSESQGGPYTKVNASPITSTQYQDTGRDDYTTYFYVVTAFEDSDPSEESDYSDEVEVATGNYELDYRDGREPNAFGGTASTHFSFVEMTRYDFTLGFAREVTLNAAETSWIGLNGVNLSQATHLSMWIKGTGTEEIEIGLEDGSSQQSFVGVTATSGWHNLHIKLDDFSGVSFNNMAKLYIRSNDTSAITLHIDDIVFERQDGSGFTLEVIPRFVSNNSRATGMSFDNNPGNEYAPANQYIEVKYGVDAENWKIWIYTNNTNGDPQYLGDQFNGLMTADGRHRVPLLWRVYPDVQAGGVPCRNHSDIYSGSNLTWNYVKDKNDGDWDSANQTGQEYSVTCYGSYTWAHLAAVPPGLGERDPVDSTYRVYLGGVFKNASAGEYSASIYFDLTHE